MNWLKKQKGKLFLLLVFLNLFFVSPVLAGEDSLGLASRLAGFLAEIILFIASGVGQLITLLIGGVLIPIVLYDDFVNSPVVEAGWAVVRDSVNMFFVLVLIAIAFGTIVGGLHRFNWKEQVPRLLLVAIFINFSRTLCGLMIDFSQVFTLTFANAIKDIAGGNLIQMFGLGSIMEASSIDLGIKPSDLIISAACALLMMLIVLVVLTFFTIVLAYRIVILWILVTVAPLAWFFKATKDIVKIGKDPYSTWWNNFTCAIVIGPVLTFTLWLALAVAGSGEISETAGIASSATSLNTGLLLEALSASKVVSFVIGICLLFAGLQAAQDACEGAGAMGSMVKSQLGKAEGISKKIAAAPAKIAAGGAKRVWSGASGGGGIKGGVLGGKFMTGAAQALGRAPVLRHIGGGKLAEIAGKNRIESKAKREKFDQTRATTMAKAGGFEDKSEAELQKLLDSGDRATSRAAIQTMSNKGLFKDDPTLDAAERAARLENIKRAREQLATNPEALSSFDDRLRKQSSSFALETIYRDAAGAIDRNKLREDIVNLKIGAASVLSGANSANAGDVAAAMGNTAAKRMKFMYDIFDGNVRNMKEAITGIEDDQIRGAMFGGIDADEVRAFTQKNKLDPSGNIVRNAAGDPVMVDDYSKRDAILSAIVGGGVSVGDLAGFYTTPSAPPGAPLSDDAKKAMARHVNSNAESYKEMFDEKVDDPATRGVTASQIESIFREIGDRINGETVAKIRNGGNELKKALDKAVNDSLVGFATAFSANPTSAAAQKQLEDAVERAVKGGAKIDINRVTSVPLARPIFEAQITRMKPEDLNKMRFESRSTTEVGRTMWGGADMATLTKLFEDAQNVTLLKAIKDHVKTAGISSTDPRYVALQKFLI